MSTTKDISVAAWRSVEDEMPDADETVLVHAADADEPVWLGYFDGDVWRCVEGPIRKVTDWAPMPDGPR